MRRKARRIMPAAVGISKAIFGTTITGLSAARLRSLRNEVIQTVMGHRKPHAAPELIATLLLDATKSDPKIASDQGAIMVVKRLIERDKGVVETVNEVRLMRQEQGRRVERVPGPVGRVMQIARSIDRELADDMILKNKGRRARVDVDLVGWQKQTIHHEIGANLMQREWDILATRCQQPEDGRRFEACRESEMGGRIGGDQAQEGTQTDEREREGEEGPLHPEVEQMVVKALRATTGEEAWLILRRAARMSRAQWAETLGTVACEVKERWGHTANYIQTNEDIKAVCEQEGVEVEQEEGGNHNCCGGEG